VPATGQPKGGILRHKGWKANSAVMPKLSGKLDFSILAPAEIEVE